MSDIFSSDKVSQTKKQTGDRRTQIVYRLEQFIIY